MLKNKARPAGERDPYHCTGLDFGAQYARVEISRVLHDAPFRQPSLLAIWSTWLVIQPALAEKRVALVVGNSTYQRVPQLANPARDADDMSDMFRKAGFTVVVAKHNLGATEMRRALRDLFRRCSRCRRRHRLLRRPRHEIEGTN